MEFEWDQKKREANLKKHGIDFVDVVQIFEGFTIKKIDDRIDYGEERNIAIGLVKGQVLVTVYTWRGDAIRIISARKAKRHEKRKYKEIFD